MNYTINFIFLYTYFNIFSIFITLVNSNFLKWITIAVTYVHCYAKVEYSYKICPLGSDFCDYA